MALLRRDRQEQVVVAVVVVVEGMSMFGVVIVVMMVTVMRYKCERIKNNKAVVVIMPLINCNENCGDEWQWSASVCRGRAGRFLTGGGGRDRGRKR